MSRSGFRNRLSYRLTEKVGLFGCGCKLPRLELVNLLKSADLASFNQSRVLAGIGDDAGVVKVSESVALVQHLDFFTPIVDDPYVQGSIAACNAASDIFAKGCVDLAGAMMIIGVPEDMPDDCLKEMVEGFKDLCEKIEVPIVGGQTIYCAWPIIGGSITGICEPEKIIYNSTAKPGDILVLTKPLGNRSTAAFARAAANVKNKLRRRIVNVDASVDSSIKFMTTPNKSAAEAMVRCGVNACTDVTGFGILGHTATMAERSRVKTVINTLPVFKGALSLSDHFGHGLERGTSAETSGGLLVSVGKRKVDEFVSELEAEQVPCYRVGYVEEGPGSIVLAKDVKIVEV